MTEGKMQLDPRTKLFLLLIANFLLFFHLGVRTEALFVIFLCVLLVLSGKSRTGFLGAVFYVSVLYVSNRVMAHNQTNFWAILGLMITFVEKFFPCILAGFFAFTTTKVSEWIASMQKLHFPRHIIIPLMVLFRFFPTVRADYHHIRNAMKFRGIAVTVFDVIKQPFLTIEYIFVPLLMSATNTALDLSASSLSRGISAPTAHSSYTNVEFQLQDWLVWGSILTIFALYGGR